jgi:EAL domain-containing protein (putative c-di-GMP-specific phosphodiesterase class I)
MTSFSTGNRLLPSPLESRREAWRSTPRPGVGSSRCSSRDFLKIDRSLTQNLDRDLMSHAIVRSIVELGHALDLSVIAEGVETSTIAATLHNLGADYGQGFHWNKPQLVRTPALRDAAA